MILFTDKMTVAGAEILNSLAYVNNCNIDDSRVTMSGIVTLSLQSNEPEYPVYNTLPTFFNVPYDPNLSANPAEQFYDYLMTLEDFEGGVEYPVIS